MINLPLSLALEKNKMSQSPWLILLHIELVNPQDEEDTEDIYIVQNTENITYQGQEYTAFPFEISATKNTMQGDLSSLKLKVSNVTRTLQSSLQAYRGGLGSTVRMTVVNAAHLGTACPELEETYIITDCSSDAQWVDFTLGGPNPLRQKFPKDIYNPYHCNWRFKSCECGYTGTTYTECNRSYSDCVERGQALNFGGFLGLRSGALRVVG